MNTLVILHGWQSSKEKWVGVTQELKKRGIKVLVPDLPGFKPETKLQRPWTLDDYVFWLENFLREKEIIQKEKFFLLGHSFGGRIAIKYTALHPENIQGLILVASAGIKDKTFKNKFWRSLSKITKRLKFDKLPFWEKIRKFFYYYLLQKRDYFQAAGPLKQTMTFVVDEDLTGFLPKINVPTLVIWGEKDKLTPLQHGRLIAKKIPFARFAVFKGVGHSPHLQCKTLLAKNILQFIKNPQNS